MDPVSAAIDPYFASTLVWEGMSLETIYGYWNPVPVMAISVAAAALLFVLAWTVYRLDRGRRAARGFEGFRAYYSRPSPSWAPPLATRVWEGVARLGATSAEVVSGVYTGNGQLYVLVALFYALALVSANLMAGW
jgi:hypothetical protein